jgi:hypothetical protein
MKSNYKGKLHIVDHVIASASEAIQHRAEKLDCFVAEPVIGRAFARPVGSSQ